MTLSLNWYLDKLVYNYVEHHVLDQLELIARRDLETLHGCSTAELESAWLNVLHQNNHKAIALYYMVRDSNYLHAKAMAT